MPKIKLLTPQFEDEELPINEDDDVQVEEDENEGAPVDEDEEELEQEDEQQPNLVPDELILKAQHDLRVNKDDRARNRVMLAYLPLLRAIVGKYKGLAPFDRQDMISAGNEALLRAISTWIPGKVSKKGKPVQFGQHVRAAIRHAVRDELNRLRGYNIRGKQKAPITRLDAPLPGDDTGKARDLPGTAPSPEQELMQQQSDDLWARETRKYISSLPGHEGELLRLRYVEGLSFKEIGDRFGIKESTAAWQLERAKKKMQALLEPKLRELQLPESLTPEDAFGAATPRLPHAE